NRGLVLSSCFGEVVFLQERGSRFIPHPRNTQPNHNHYKGPQNQHCSDHPNRPLVKGNTHRSAGLTTEQPSRGQDNRHEERQQNGQSRLMEIRINRSMREQSCDGTHHPYEELSLEPCQVLFHDPCDLLRENPQTPPNEKQTDDAELDPDL